MRNQTTKLTRSIRIVLIFCLALFLCACAPKHIVYKEVKVPIKCDIPKREKPPKHSNITLYLKEILIYTELLESDLNFCRGEAKSL